MAKFFFISVLLQFCATRDHQQIIKLNNDGSVADASNLPKCSDGARINLLSYSILNENCIPNINCEVQLSPTQQVYIHQMCSLKEACEVMNLSIKDKRSDLNGRNFFLKVKYECLGE